MIMNLNYMQTIISNKKSRYVSSITYIILQLAYKQLQFIRCHKPKLPFTRLLKNDVKTRYVHYSSFSQQQWWLYSSSGN